MKLIAIDWLIIATYFALSLAIGRTRVILLLLLATISVALMWWNLSRTSWARIAEAVEPRIGSAVHKGAD